MLFLVQIILVLTCVVLSALILLQPGQSEGLAGALGGYGMQSPFGTKTARKIVRLTFYLALFTLALVILVEVWQKREGFALSTTRARETPAAAETVPVEKPASEEKTDQGG